jgi:hypothetical protein
MQHQTQPSLGPQQACKAEAIMTQTLTKLKKHQELKHSRLLHPWIYHIKMDKHTNKKIIKGCVSRPLF